ncbi:hypothetical protein JQ632_36395 [Bradyrhizobium liaoningense]|nr:hypothetical protein [Bradyrhizobium liaoningense]
MATHPQFRTAFHLKATVRLATGVRCPHCETELRPEDVEPLEYGRVPTICFGCLACCS